MQHNRVDEEPEYLAAQLRKALAEDTRTGELGVQLAVREGRVHLSGAVSAHHYKAELDRVVRELEPLVTVHNDVSVVESGEPGEPEVLN